MDQSLCPNGVDATAISVWELSRNLLGVDEYVEMRPSTLDLWLLTEDRATYVICGFGWEDFVGGHHP